jgi:hypothetical protein
MRNLALIISSFAVTIFCWGVYGPVLHSGRVHMAEEGGHALWRPFICVGLAYMAIGIIVPAVLLVWRGEKGQFSPLGILWSFIAGAVGAVGALGILLAFEYGGRPVYVMPLVFGGAPVVNAFVTIYMTNRMKEVGPIFLAGLIMVGLGAVIVLIFKPQLGGADHAADATPGTNILWQVVWILLTILCWGTYGPWLHKGQEAMQHSRLRPLICVGAAYFIVGVIMPAIILSLHTEASGFANIGSLWSLAAGAAGAFGAIGIIMAFNFGGRPVYVMPLIFGGAPVVNSFWTIIAADRLDQVSPWFLSGMILVIAGAAIVLVFAPRGTAKTTPDVGMFKKKSSETKEAAKRPDKEQASTASASEQPGDAAERPTTT